MHDCDFIRENFDDWSDGLLDGAEAARFDEHVTGCERCAAFVAEERRIGLDLAALNSIANRIAHEGPTTAPAARRRRSGWRIAAAIALFAVGGYVVTLVSRRASNSDESKTPAVAHVDTVGPAAVQTSFILPEGDTRLSVRVASDNPRIHMFWIYETVSAPSASADREPPGDIGPGNAVPDTSRS